MGQVSVNEDAPPALWMVEFTVSVTPLVRKERAFWSWAGLPGGPQEKADHVCVVPTCVASLNDGAQKAAFSPK